MLDVRTVLSVAALLSGCGPRNRSGGLAGHSLRRRPSCRARLLRPLFRASPALPSLSVVGIDSTCVMIFGFEIEQPLPAHCATSLETLSAGSPPPDDLICTAGGRRVILILSSGATRVIPGGILGVTPTP